MDRSVGRPPWIPTPEILEQVEGYAALGLTQQQIADCLGIHVATLCDKKNEYVEFSEAIKRGESKGIAMVANELTKNAKAGNVTAQIFFLKCRAKWNDQHVDDLQKLIQSEIAPVRDMINKWQAEKA